MGSVRTLLITGAAGAGRTTVAASTAVAAARAGASVLLLTADGEVAEGLLPPSGGVGLPAASPARDGTAARGRTSGGRAAGPASGAAARNSAGSPARGAAGAGLPGAVGDGGSAWPGPAAGGPGVVSGGGSAASGAGGPGDVSGGGSGWSGPAAGEPGASGGGGSAASGAGAGGGGVSVTGLPRPYPVDGVDGLYVARVDAGASFRAEALDLQGRVGGLLALLGAAPLDPEELTPLPGADALALLRALRESHPQHAVAADGRGSEGPPPSPAWDLVVVDLPPVRDAVALLALPEQLRRYLWRLLPADRQAARSLRPVFAQLVGVPMPAEWAYGAAARADRELAAVQAVIEDPGTQVAVVVEPGPYAEGTLRTARAGLALYGHRLTAVAANRLLPTGSVDPFLAGLSGRQHEHLKGLAEQCAADAVPLRELPHLGGEPHAGDELAVPVGVSEAVDRTPEPWTVEDRLGADGHFVWSLPLPGAGREGLDLVRRGDELVVDAAGFRRIMPLPSALRRCTVEGAALRDGALRVRFTPDPELWPH